MVFQEKLKRLLHEQGISQIQFARDLGITRARLNHYITGRSEPGNGMLVRIAKTLGTSTDYLLGTAAETSDRRGSLLILDSDRPEFAPEDAAPSGSGWIPLYESAPVPLSGTRLPVARMGWLRSGLVRAAASSRMKPYALYINDNSMAPKVLRGDIACIQPCYLNHILLSPSMGEELTAVRLCKADPVGLSLKRCRLKGNTLLFVADDLRYQPVALDMDSVLFVPLVGKVSFVWRAREEEDSPAWFGEMQ